MKRQLWTRVTLRDGLLIFESPAMRGARVKRYRFNVYDDAFVGRVLSKRDRGRYLILRRRISGQLEPTLENLNHCVGDLEIVAATLREAMSRRRAD
jgi:hypothetical protein